MIYKLYSDVFSSKIVTVGGSNFGLSFIESRNKIFPCPRMMEYNLIDQDILDDLICNDRRKYGDFFESLISLNKKLVVYSYSDSLIVKCLPEFFLNNKHKVLNIDFITNVQVLDTSRFLDFEQYLNTLSRKRRYKVKKALESDMELTRTTDSNDFVAFSNMHIRQWRENGDPSILENKHWYEFYKHLFESKEFILHKLTIGEEAVAYHLGFFKNGTFQYLMPTYSSAHAKYSPGFALLVKLIHHCFSEEINEFNFGSGQYEYKMWLSNFSRPLIKITVKKSILRNLYNNTLINLKPKIKMVLKRFF